MKGTKKKQNQVELVGKKRVGLVSGFSLACSKHKLSADASIVDEDDRVAKQIEINPTMKLHKSTRTRTKFFITILNAAVHCASSGCEQALAGKSDEIISNKGTIIR